MSVRFDASGDQYSASTGLPGTSFTAVWWARIAVDRNAYSTMVAFDNNTEDQVLAVQTDSDGVSPYLWLKPHGTGFAEASPSLSMAVGSWYRFAIVRSGSAITFYAAPVSGSVSIGNATLSGSLGITRMRVAHSVVSNEWLNGNIANLKVYNSALSQAEIITEWSNWQDQKGGILRHHTWRNAAETVDYSANGHVLTSGGTPAFSAENPSLADSAPGDPGEPGGSTITVGKVTDGSASSASTSDKTAVSLHTAGGDGILVSGRARVWVSGGSATANLVVYANTGGEPGALLAQSNDKTITSTTEIETGFTFSGAEQIAIVDGTSYWVGVSWLDPGTESLTISRDAVAGGRRESSAYLPDPFGTPATLTGPIDAFLEVETSAPPVGSSSPLRLGSQDVVSLRLGASALLRAYMGTSLVWGAAPASGGSPTGGTGGPLTDRTSVSYSNGTKTSTYHIYAADLDWTKRVGLLVYGDGSGEQGLSNTADTYLMAGANGLIAKAKAHNMVLVTPRAPGNGCTDGDGVCWYLPSFDGTTLAQKTKWLDDLIKTQVLPLYNVDKTRVCIAGFSSGAELTMGTYSPQYAASWMEDGLLLAISYGSSPSQYGIPNNYTVSFKSKVACVWDVRGGDTTTAPADSLEGYNYYNSNGFTTTERTVIPGGTHDRPGEFGGLVDQYLTEYLIPTGA
jgi:hypothetical protein